VGAFSSPLRREKRTSFGIEFKRSPASSAGRPINRPISDASASAGNAHVFRHVLLRAGFPYVFSESGRRWRERAKCAGIGGRNRTFYVTEFCLRDSHAFYRNRPSGGESRRIGLEAASEFDRSSIYRRIQKWMLGCCPSHHSNLGGRRLMCGRDNGNCNLANWAFGSVLSKTNAPLVRHDDRDHALCTTNATLSK
jgi:hypothetical protein